MIAAIYCRKSTEQHVSEDAKSVSIQRTLARAFAAEMKWDVIEDYVDDAVSGADTAKLLNRARMIGDAAAGKFQVLIIRDLDRLSRDDREENVVYTLEDCGVQVWTYVDRMRVDTSTALQRGMLGMKATFAAAEREAASKRTQEKMRLKVERGEAGGGRGLGYRNVGDPGSRRREVNPSEADIVTRIFRLAVEGKRLLKIAKTLNAEGVVNPTGQDRTKLKKRTDQWSSTGIREILHRELYLGRVVYGLTTWTRRRDRATGLAKKVKVTASKAPVVREDATLRIVSDELWAAARERMAATHAVYLRRIGGQLGGKPASGLESRHQLAGFLRCGVCGGNMIISKKTGKRGRPQTAYVCSTRLSRGDSACSNRYGAPATPLTDAVLAELKHIFLNPAALGNLLMREWAERAKAPQALEEQRQDLTAKISKLETELSRLADAVASGSTPATLVAAIRQREEARLALQAKLEYVNGLTIEKEEFSLAEWLDETREILEELRETLEADPAAGRQVLRRLLVGTINVTPRVKDKTLYFDLAGTISYARFDGTTATMRPVSSELITGHISRRVQRWCPRGDSNTRHAV